MRLREARDLVRPPSHSRSSGKAAPSRARALARCHDVDDLRLEARRRLPRAVFDYIDGGADNESTLTANESAFASWRFTPRVLIDVTSPDLTTSILGQDVPLPVGFAPTGYTRMAHPDGELAVAKASATLGVPYCVSTVATTAVEDVARVAGPGTWCQLYLLRDRALSWALMKRAYDAGVRVLEVSVDTAVAGHRTRDVKRGLTIPPSLTLGTLLDIGVHPRYWTRMLRAPAFTFANFTNQLPAGSTVSTVTEQFDPSTTWDDFAEIRERWEGALTVKGPLGPRDAKRATAMGADAIHLSNHGGRQLDRCIAALDLVRPVREAIGDTPIIIDSGIRHGMDVAVALARGANFAMLGRPYLYGLSIDGQAGAEHVMSIIQAQLRRTFQLLGVTSIRDLQEHADDLIVQTGGLSQ